MRRLPLIAAPLALALWVAGVAPARAQQTGTASQPNQASSQASGDATQQAARVPPQKKKAGKKEASHKKSREKLASSPAPASSKTTAPGQSGSVGGRKAASPQTPPDAASDGKGGSNANPFPEDVSRRAAEAAASRAAAPSAPTLSSPAPSSPAPSAPAPSTKSNPNPFPEAVSRRAAEAAGNLAPAAKTQTAPQVPPGVSSSSSVTLENLGNSPASDRVTVTDPVRAKKDIQVGDFYLSRGDAKGAYMRYKDALAYDPENMNAVYGLAESAVRLKKFAEAERNYKFYLQVIPTGGKSKQAAKELLALANRK